MIPTHEEAVLKISQFRAKGEDEKAVRHWLRFGKAITWEEFQKIGLLNDQKNSKQEDREPIGRRTGSDYAEAREECVA